MNLKEALAILPETKNNVVSVLSGGLDSTIMTYVLVHKYGASNVFALSYNYGQKQSLELKKAEETCNALGIQHKIIDIGFLGDIVSPVCANIATSDVAMPTIHEVLGDPQPPSYVPYRNLILNSTAMAFAETNNASYIFTGLQVHDEYGYWDTSQKFVDSLNAVSSLNRMHKIEVRAPFSMLSKYEEINIATELGNVDFTKTLTCYDPNNLGHSCGVCPSCSERIKNFMLSGIADPINYSIDIDWDSGIKQHKK
ncbi:queuosine biosynthesis protein [Vibrio phage 2.275.O._10N.286.54.E11]|nr:queuosine biosynthesis protein [Vibrio phage 2.275.O._10N.286.54.E11]